MKATAEIAECVCSPKSLFIVRQGLNKKSLSGNLNVPAENLIMRFPPNLPNLAFGDLAGRQDPQSKMGASRKPPMTVGSGSSAMYSRLHPKTSRGIDCKHHARTGGKLNKGFLLASCCNRHISAALLIAMPLRYCLPARKLETAVNISGKRSTSTLMPASALVA